jgi:hypothetical protein
MSNKKQIIESMRNRVEDCRDPRTGELNHTLLAEQVAEEFELYDGHDYEIPPELFEWAADFK